MRTTLIYHTVTPVTDVFETEQSFVLSEDLDTTQIRALLKDGGAPNYDPEA